MAGSFSSTPQAADIQGDILLDGFPKIRELFCFFQITDAAAFRTKLPTFTEKWVTTLSQQQLKRKEIIDWKSSQPRSLGGDEPSLEGLPLALVNIAFSKSGLSKLQTDGSLVKNLDDHLLNGMQKDALDLNDPAKKTDHDVSITQDKYIPDWSPAFLSDNKEVFIDGLLLVAGSREDFLNSRLNDITTTGLEGSLKGSIKVHKVLTGKQRDKKGQEKNEHFGFLDGVSEPWVQEVDGVDQDQTLNQDKHRQEVKLAEIVCQKTDWTNNGSYMVFRYLVQKVPEFKSFCAQRAAALGIPPMNFLAGDVRIPKGQQGPITVQPSDVLAARMVGRWPNGISITETAPSASITPQSKIDFSILDVKKNVCPYAAHIRKTAPRDVTNANHHIMRRGIQFGDELRSGENNLSDFLDNGRVFLDYTKEKNFRGLLFACYQSNIGEGFHFMQKRWCDNEGFPFQESGKKGIDPLIGQVDPLAPRKDTSAQCKIAGMKDPKDGRMILDSMPFVNELILPAGGEYFFVPSMTALRNNLTTGKA